MLTTRSATAADIAFLAHVIYEASLPPANHSFWDDLLEGSDMSAEYFIAAMLKNRATNWRQAEDFLIVEREGRSLAASSMPMSLLDLSPMKRSMRTTLSTTLGLNLKALPSLVSSLPRPSHRAEKLLT